MFGFNKAIYSLIQELTLKALAFHDWHKGLIYTRRIKSKTTP
jgi:hypothetical protein